ncbi:hypothetical protein B0H13DRAFT_636776 [Mycena leptocephala]|nr:hypothetical protein B0H13DRAFT_636776 [Mycena leptocephala]
MRFSSPRGFSSPPFNIRGTTADVEGTVGRREAQENDTSPARARPAGRRSRERAGESGAGDAARVVSPRGSRTRIGAGRVRRGWTRIGTDEGEQKVYTPAPAQRAKHRTHGTAHPSSPPPSPRSSSWTQRRTRTHPTRILFTAITRTDGQQTQSIISWKKRPSLSQKRMRSPPYPVPSATRCPRGTTRGRRGGRGAECVEAYCALFFLYLYFYLYRKKHGSMGGEKRDGEKKERDEDSEDGDERDDEEKEGATRSWRRAQLAGDQGVAWAFIHRSSYSSGGEWLVSHAGTYPLPQGRGAASNGVSCVNTFPGWTVERRG